MASLPNALRTTRLALIKAANDLVAVNTGKLVIYNGPVPANADATPAGETVLATLTNVTIVQSGNTATVTATANTAAATGVPSYARLMASNNVVYMQVSATGTGSGAELNLNQNTALGGTVTLTSGTIPEGNA